MPDSDKDIEAIAGLERFRYRAVEQGDFDAFAGVCHPDLLYTHANGETDSLESYLRKCREGFYVYHRVEQSPKKIVIVADVALVLGEMSADITVGGVEKKLRICSLSVWVRDGETWKFVGYQPTPTP
jgi:ketosteroid isomerase-like protein